MDQISRIGMDTSKHVFQLHGVNAAEAVVLRKKLRRKEMVAFFEKLAPTVIAIEACGASHHRARLLQSFGHTVKLIPPQLVKPYVKRGKNDAADAEALCEAMSRPTMRCVPVKSPEQQAALMLVSLRDRLIRNRTQLANAIRGHAAEFGLTAAQGMAHLVPLLERIQANESLPALARELFAMQVKEYEQLQTQIGEVDTQLLARHRADECSRRLAKIPGVGPVGAMLLRMKTPEPELFRSGRQFAAWIGLTPKDHSTAGKVRLGVITRAGDEGLHSVRVVGATAAIQQAQRRGTASPWLAALLKRKSPKLAAVALANKTARIAWKLMLTGEDYSARLLLGFGVVPGPSRNQAGDEGAEQGFAASASVVHELEEAEIEWQLVLRKTPMRAQPGAQQRPKPFHRVDVDPAKTVAVLVAGILAAPMADRLVPVAPSRQAGVDAVFVRVDESARGDRGGDDRLDFGLLHVGQHAQHNLAATLDQAKDRWFVLFQRAASRRARQPATPTEPPLLAIAAGWPLCPATT